MPESSIRLFRAPGTHALPEPMHENRSGMANGRALTKGPRNYFLEFNVDCLADVNLTKDIKK
jgi:hypothetical protein